MAVLFAHTTAAVPDACRRRPCCGLGAAAGDVRSSGLLVASTLDPMETPVGGVAQGSRLLRRQHLDADCVACVGAVRRALAGGWSVPFRCGLHRHGLDLVPPGPEPVTRPAPSRRRFEPVRSSAPTSEAPRCLWRSSRRLAPVACVAMEHTAGLRRLSSGRRERVARTARIASRVARSRAARP